MTKNNHNFKKCVSILYGMRSTVNQHLMSTEEEGGARKGNSGQGLSQHEQRHIIGKQPGLLGE